MLSLGEGKGINDIYMEDNINQKSNNGITIEERINKCTEDIGNLIAQKGENNKLAELYCKRGRLYWRYHEDALAIKDCNEGLKLVEAHNGCFEMPPVFGPKSKLVSTVFKALLPGTLVF